jgi:hypothetical protein
VLAGAMPVLEENMSFAGSGAGSDPAQPAIINIADKVNTRSRKVLFLLTENTYIQFLFLTENTYIQFLFPHENGAYYFAPY